MLRVALALFCIALVAFAALPGQLFLLPLAVLVLVGPLATVLVLTWPRPLKRAGLTIAAIWLVLLAIPFGDLIPGKMRLSEACKNAGVEMLPAAGKEVRISEKSTIVETFDIRRSEQQFGWGVIGSTELVQRKDNGAPVAILRSFYLRDGHKGWAKPWLSGECPMTAAVAAGQTHAGQVVRDELRKKLAE